MKSTWFGTRERYDFGRLLHDSSSGHQCWTTFDWFLDLASMSLRQAANAVRLYFDDDLEAKYMQVVSQVKHPAKLAEAFSVLVDSMSKTPDDFLGKFLSEMGMNDKAWRGQCFTPTEVSRCVAEMCLVDIKRDKPSHRLLIAEPACGCGSMVIAASCVLRENDFGPNDYYFVATDIDSRCHRATYIQSTLLDIPATVIHGNTLSLEQWASWDTLRAIVSPYREPIRKATSQPAPCQTLPTSTKPIQLSLF